MLRKALTIVLILIGLATESLFSQAIDRKELVGSDLNAIQSAVPFLNIAPDSRSGAMGDVGVATDPDVNSLHWNAAKYAFIKEEAGVGISYTPWLRNLVPDINLAYLIGYKRLDRQQVISGSLRYFSLGEIIFTNQFGQVIKPFNPNEFALDAGYSRLFSDNFSGALAFRFIRSDLTGNFSQPGVTDGDTKAGVAYAADISFYYNKDIEIEDKDANMAFGMNISNIGNKISYTDNMDPEFIPINLRLGGNLKLQLDDYNTMAFSLDLNKLLVPSPPEYFKDSLDANNEPVVEYGYDPNVPVPLGMVRSFYDAPGGFREEIREIMVSLGTEYWYREQFAIRAGYFHEAAMKGNRKYLTFGVGLKMNVFGIDFAYLAPVSGRQNPLANTIRFTLLFDFDRYRNTNTN
ncbi:MAG: type IX secretion system outer membrane channel protein PorV [Bacteroidales bacterium]